MAHNWRWAYEHQPHHLERLCGIMIAAYWRSVADQLGRDDRGAVPPSETTPPDGKEVGMQIEDSGAPPRDG